MPFGGSHYSTTHPPIQPPFSKHRTPNEAEGTASLALRPFGPSQVRSRGLVKLRQAKEKAEEELKDSDSPVRGWRIGPSWPKLVRFF